MIAPLPPQVRTTQGLVEGDYQAGVAVFKGLPYAAPPLGRLRWQPPQHAAPWSNTRLAHSFGPSAPQNPSNAARFKEFVVEGPQSEDCLYLNIWTPAPDQARRPVMVWIHGGLFTMGSGSQSVFDGSMLADRQNVVVVTLNYRLGCLGFLNLNEFTGGRIPAVGNEGLLDQIAALRWLRNNIAAFGGDPENITLFGESAGGASIECLLCMPAARGLFHKAIMQSGMHQFISLEEAAVHTNDFLHAIGIKSGMVAELSGLPVERLLAGQKKLNRTGQKRPGGLFPVVDGVNLPAQPVEIFRQGNEANMPVLIGYNREETRLFQALHAGQTVNRTQLIKQGGILRPNCDAGALIEYYQAELVRQGENSFPADILVALQTDLNFRLPALELLNSLCRNSHHAFAYQFNWQSPALGGILGACHGMEIGFIFGHYDDSFGGSGPAADRLSLQMQAAWAAFARTGNPACPAIGEWAAYCPEQFLKIIGLPVE